MAATMQVRTDGQAKVEQTLARLVSRMSDTLPLMDGIGLYLESATIERFDREQAPDGSKWKPSHRARAEGGKTLTDSARLKQSITHNASATRVEVGTNVIYAAVHQFGAKISAKSKKGLAFTLPGVGLVFAKSVTIPARPFLGMSAEDETEVVQLAEDYVADGIPEIER